MKKVLIIEDDREISNLLNIHLKDQGCEVESCFDGRSGLNSAQSDLYDLIILDIMLPELDGFEVCKELRKAENITPIIMLTSKSDETDKVLGLEFGADDYLTKPFSIRELLARVKAIFRRIENIKKEREGNGELKFGELRIDSTKRIVLLNQNRIELTPKEFDLLYLLASHPGRTYTRENLLNLIWGTQYSGYEHTVNSHINRLRSKIEKDVSQPEYILTSWGVGYRFNDQIE